MMSENLTPQNVTDAASTVNSDRLLSEVKRWNHALGPIGAGLIIDAVDLATFGPFGLALGLPIGGLAGYWMARSLNLDNKGVWFCTIAAGVYCTIPFTEFLPLATLVGACVRFQDAVVDEPPAGEGDESRS